MNHFCLELFIPFRYFNIWFIVNESWYEWMGSYMIHYIIMWIVGIYLFIERYIVGTTICISSTYLDVSPRCETCTWYLGIMYMFHVSHITCRPGRPITYLSTQVWHKKIPTTSVVITHQQIGTRINSLEGNHWVWLTPESFSTT
jgi:hypothetical protein